MSHKLISLDAVFFGGAVLVYVFRVVLLDTLMKLVRTCIKVTTPYSRILCAVRVGSFLIDRHALQLAYCCFSCSWEYAHETHTHIACWRLVTNERTAITETVCSIERHNWMASQLRATPMGTLCAHGGQHPPSLDYGNFTQVCAHTKNCNEQIIYHTCWWFVCLLSIITQLHHHQPVGLLSTEWSTCRLG